MEKERVSCFLYIVTHFMMGKNVTKKTFFYVSTCGGANHKIDRSNLCASTHFAYTIVESKLESNTNYVLLVLFSIF